MNNDSPLLLTFDRGMLRGILLAHKIATIESALNPSTSNGSGVTNVSEGMVTKSLHLMVDLLDVFRRWPKYRDKRRRFLFLLVKKRLKNHCRYWKSMFTPRPSPCNSWWICRVCTEYLFNRLSIYVLTCTSYVLTCDRLVGFFVSILDQLFCTFHRWTLVLPLVIVTAFHTLLAYGF